jgi:hypothetical protein
MQGNSKQSKTTNKNSETLNETINEKTLQKNSS